VDETEDEELREEPEPVEWPDPWSSAARAYPF
jgi:hypothetical protein